MSKLFNITNIIILLVVLGGGYGLFKALTYTSINEIQTATLDLSKPSEPEATVEVMPEFNNPSDTATIQPQPQQTPPPIPQIGADQQPANQPPIDNKAPTNTGSLISRWQNNSDDKYQINYRADNTVEEFYNNESKGTGTWEYVKPEAGQAGPSTQILRVTLNGQISDYQIINLSASNLSYVNSAKGEIVSFKRLPE
ncbi:hypothetical protein KKC17_03445 [Patescibacteria group bacterium]|nr:hypothetical protein [Patescibacteria group bacterium]